MSFKNAMQTSALAIFRANILPTVHPVHKTCAAWLSEKRTSVAGRERQERRKKSISTVSQEQWAKKKVKSKKAEVTAEGSPAQRTRG